MNRLPISLTIGLLLVLSSATAFAQRHHFPSMAGKYEIHSGDICQIAQDANVIWVSGRIPGVSSFQYVGKFGQGEQLNEQGQVITRSGFHGNYRLSFDDGRPAKEGAAGVYHNSRTGNAEICYFSPSGQLLGTAVLRRADKVASQQPPKLSETKDEFDLLPVDDLKSLGL